MSTATQLRADKAALEREIAEMDAKRRQLALINELLKFYPDNAEGVSATPINATLAPASAPYAGMGASKASVAFLRSRPTEFFTSREIAEEIKQGGVESSSENFLTTVHANCARKAEAGEFELGQKNGVKAYRIKSDAV